jgi:hypothetical protein
VILKAFDNSIVIDFQGLVILFKMTDPNLKIKKELDIHIKADNLVSEIQNEIERLYGKVEMDIINIRNGMT